MIACPHCNHEINFASIPHSGLWQNFRECPHCAKAFTVDPQTKRRQAVALGVALLALVLTILMYFEGLAWLPPAAISYIVLTVLIYRGNKLVRLVTHPGGS